MKIYLKLILIFLICFVRVSYSQQQDKPKLIVGVVIDQMKAEYLYRFQDNYTENGFKRLLREGFNVKNAHYNYTPTATGPGHASIYTGTTPSNHGIVANNWFNKKLEKKIYCAEDSIVFLVDNSGIKKGSKNTIFSRSPKNIKTTTITDELKLFTNYRSKVIGVSIKDRAAIFPAGHLADAAYWYNGNNGNFITSTYYNDKLPNWLKRFNNLKKADSLLNLVWQPFLPIEKYIHSGDDNNSFEKKYKGKNESTFPYDLKEIRKENGDFSLLPETPFGNEILTELVKAVLIGESLGKGVETDFLAISYSSTDFVGHYFGVRSKELEDTYVRMDREIEKLLNYLDQEVGKGNYTLFLTADHGGSDHPKFLRSKKLQGKFYNPITIKEELNEFLFQEYGVKNSISYMYDNEIYFNTISKIELVEKATLFLKTIEGVKEVFVPQFPNWNIGNSTIGEFVKNSYCPERSGDIYLQFDSGWMLKRDYGCSHSTSYSSDTHVPLLWYGMNIQNGETVKHHTITQIAPTLSLMFNIPLASASTLNPINELFK